MKYPIDTTKVKGKVIRVTGRRGLQRCETSRFSHFLDNRLTDDDDRPLPPRKIPGTHFC
jgi:hypothetical protein